MNFHERSAVQHLYRRANWSGPAGLGIRIAEHLKHTLIAVLFSALIAIPVGLLIGPPAGAPSWWSPASTRYVLCPPWVCCCSVSCCGGWG